MTVSRLRRYAPALVVVALAAGLSGCSSSMSDAATVEYPYGTGAKTMSVNLNDFEKELGELTANEDFRKYLETQQISVTKDNADSVFATVWLSDLITQTAVDREFERLGLKLEPADVTQAVRELEAPNAQVDPPLLAPSRIPPDVYKKLSESYRTTLAERRARGDRVLAAWETAGPAEAQEFFEQYKEAFECKSVSHVLVKTEAEAKQVLADLEAGEEFADIARETSTDTGSAPQGGQLGCLQPGQFVEAFQNAADTAPLDTPVGPIETEFGFHVIEVQSDTPTYEEVSAQLIPALKQGAAVKQAVATAEVTVNPRFGSPGAAQGDQQTGVVQYRLRPPESPSVASGRDATTTTVPFAG
jgi:peptidyl-prolyl cis-trans isomerase C